MKHKPNMCVCNCGVKELAKEHACPHLGIHTRLESCEYSYCRHSSGGKGKSPYVECKIYEE